MKEPVDECGQSPVQRASLWDGKESSLTERGRERERTIMITVNDFHKSGWTQTQPTWNMSVFIWTGYQTMVSSCQFVAGLTCHCSRPVVPKILMPCWYIIGTSQEAIRLSLWQMLAALFQLWFESQTIDSNMNCPPLAVVALNPPMFRWGYDNGMLKMLKAPRFDVVARCVKDMILPQ